MTEHELIDVRAALAELDTNQLITYCDSVYKECDDAVSKTQFEALCTERATELKCKTLIANLFKAIHRQEDIEYREQRDRTQKAERLAKLSVTMAKSPEEIPLNFTRIGTVKATIDNYLNIMQYDSYYDGLRYNELAARFEMHKFNADGDPAGIDIWDDTTRAYSLHHIETTYGDLRDESCHDNAIRMLRNERRFNPITDRIKSLPEWDGKERCKTFLTDIMKADGSEYTQAVSQMLFDGAVARAFIPGIKYDNVVVLVGKQGCGKSTMCECMALDDEYHAEIKTFDDKAVETLRGKWIVEIGEMFAVTGAKSQDRVKSFITATKDDYRFPYDRLTTHLPRRCIFIGDTNSDEFLSDPTGGRRWYPVKLYGDAAHGTYLQQNREILIEEIELCYAEAYHRYLNNELQLIVPDEVAEEARRKQKEAQLLPWYFGEIERYIREEMEIGDKTHGLFLWEKVLGQDKDKYKTVQREISAILHNMPCLEYAGVQRFSDHTRQRAFRKTANPD